MSFDYTPATITTRRDGAGRYVIRQDERFAVESDGWGYVTQAEYNGSGIGAGVTGGEWIVTFEGDHNGDWEDTKREALATVGAVMAAQYKREVQAWADKIANSYSDVQVNAFTISGKGSDGITATWEVRTGKLVRVA